MYCYVQRRWGGTFATFLKAVLCSSISRYKLIFFGILGPPRFYYVTIYLSKLEYAYLNKFFISGSDLNLSEHFSFVVVDSFEELVLTTCLVWNSKLLVVMMLNAEIIVFLLVLIFLFLDKSLCVLYVGLLFSLSLPQENQGRKRAVQKVAFCDSSQNHCFLTSIFFNQTKDKKLALIKKIYLK